MKISTLSEYETLQIIASVESIFSSHWNCYKCMTDKNHERMKKVKGCVYTPKTNYKVEGYQLNKCLGNFSSREIYGYFDMLKSYEAGVMPHGGSFAQQSAKLIDLFNMIMQLRDEKYEKMREEAAKKKKIEIL